MMQMICWIETLHKKGFVHWDIKPSNFIFDQSENQVLHLIDFGLSEWVDQLIENEQTGFIGTRKYSSRTAHTFKALSKWDDIESLGYTFVFLVNGEYKWKGLEQLENGEKLSKEESHWILSEEKDLKSLESGLLMDLDDDLKEMMIEYFKYCREMEFDSDPDYQYLKRLFKSQLTGEFEAKINIP